jgi:hypothetical protein
LLNWTAKNQGLPVSPVTALTITDSVIVAGTFGKGVFRSTDWGESWQATNMNYHFVKKIVVTPQQGIFTGTLGHGIFRSTDRGLTWSSANNGLTNLFVYDFIYEPGGYLYAATDGQGVFRSVNSGQTWIPANLGLPLTEIRALAADAERIYAGGQGQGLYSSDNHGDTWSAFPSPDSMKQIIGITPTHPMLVATEQNGIFMLQAATSIRDHENSDRPKQFLIHNFPNPFNSSSTIRFYVPVRESIKLSIYNLLGEEIITLKEGYFSEGWQQIIWNGKDHRNRDVASGMYITRLRGSSFSATKKLLLIK